MSSVHTIFTEGQSGTFELVPADDLSHGTLTLSGILRSDNGMPPPPATVHLTRHSHTHTTDTGTYMAPMDWWVAKTKKSAGHSSIAAPHVDDTLTIVLYHPQVKKHKSKLEGEFSIAGNMQGVVERRAYNAASFPGDYWVHTYPATLFDPFEQSHRPKGPKPKRRSRPDEGGGDLDPANYGDLEGLSLELESLWSYYPAS